MQLVIALLLLFVCFKENFDSLLILVADQISKKKKKEKKTKTIVVKGIFKV